MASHPRGEGPHGGEPGSGAQLRLRRQQSEAGGLFYSTALSLGLFIQEQGALPALVRVQSVFSRLGIQSVLMKWWEWSKF